MRIKTIVAALLISFLMAVPSFAETRQVAIALDTVSDETMEYCPGANADYKLTLKNLLGDSWVRVKFKFSKRSVAEAFSDKNLNILDGWEKHGEYYYYTKKVPARTDIAVVDGLTIPMVENGKKGARVTVTVDADAIQYDVNSPDFKKDNPWDGAEIKRHSSASSSGAGFQSVTSDVRIYTAPQENAVSSIGIWKLVSQEKRQWKYLYGDGDYAKDGWVYVYNPYSKSANKSSWFHFDKDGFMTYGWYKASDSVWYYTHEKSDGDLGKLETGWHKDDEDGRIYYLDAKNGVMLAGLQEIDGKTYYFATRDDIPDQTWFWETGLGKWIYKKAGYRTFGSLYMNEKIPDGRLANAIGEVQK